MSTTLALLDPLSVLQSLSQNLLLSLGSPIQSNKPHPPPTSSSTDAFLKCDRDLAAAIELVQAHQLKQKKIEALKADLLAMQAKWKDICIEMENGKRELENMIKEADERIAAINEAQTGEPLRVYSILTFYLKKFW
jgi:mediator of RNA polymerase II transcription subunit 4